MKKSFTIVFVLVAALLLFTACPSPNDDTPSQSADMTAEQIEALLNPVNVTMAEKTWTEPLKVGIISDPATLSSFFETMINNMESVFSTANGYVAYTCYTREHNEELTKAQQFIDDGVDYLLISPVYSNGWNDVLQNAKDEGVKVIFYKYKADVDESMYETYVASNVEIQGKKAVAWLSKQNLAQYDIVHLQAPIGSIIQRDRTKPLDDMVTKNAKWNLIERDTGGWSTADAKTIVKGVIDSGKSFNVIYAENDYLAKGAVKALDEAGITHGVNGDVLIVSFECYKWALQELKKGTWNCDVQENPFQAVYVHNAIVALEKGVTVPKNILVDDRVFDAETITQEDVDTYGL